jgi:hypothetical protein
MPFNNERTFTVVYPVPIPVGHKVKLQFYLKPEGILKKKYVPQENQPLITDLDTGIEYGSFWHYKNVMSMSASSYTANEYPFDVRNDIEPAESFTGKVKKCRLLTEAFSDIWKVQTLLVIELDF